MNDREMETKKLVKNIQAREKVVKIVGQREDVHKGKKSSQCKKI